jgi:hypothetical protein
MNVVATSMTIPDVATQEYAKISLRALATASLLAPALLSAALAPWRKREILRIGPFKWS